MLAGAFGPGREFEHLRVERKIGHGGFATVWLATDTRLPRSVALKVLASTDPDLDPSDRKHVLKEARILASLNSPYVVTLYDVYETEEHGWVFEMEYVGGGSLETLLKEGPLDPERTIQILRDVARGLKAAQDAGIVHGDVKPANVLLDSDGTAKLADFGLARLIQEQSLVFSADGLPKGTPWYMAPEVWAGQPRTLASDLWSFGTVVYELAAGRRAFDGASIEAIFHAVHNTEPTPLDPSASPALAHLVTHCLSKDPAGRPKDFGYVIRTLDEQTPTRFPPPVPAAPPRPATLPLFGRQDELARLEGLLDRVLGGRGAAVLVTGEAGIGKTALMHEVASCARRRGLSWIETRITPVEGLVRPLFQELRRHVSGTDFKGSFGSSAPALEAALAADAPALESPEQVTWAIERLLEGLAVDHPVGLLVEDAHEGRAEEVRMLAELGLRLAPARVFLAVTYRLHGLSDSTPGEERRAQYFELTSRQEFEHLELKDLDPESILNIVETTAGCDGVDPMVAYRITHLAQGNPLFAKELLRHLLEQSAVACRERTVEPGPTWGRARLPQRIQDLVAHRLQGLTEEQRQVLDVAAVDGLEFDGDAVAAVLELKLLQVLRILQNLYRDRGLVLPQPSGFRIAHPVIHEVIRDDTAPDLRTAIHRRLAEHLESRGPDAGVDPERIGTHWEQAGRLDRAVPHLLQAASRTGLRQELGQTIDLCARAGLVPGRIPASLAISHSEALLSLAISFSDAGRHEEADAVLGNLIAAAEAENDDELRLRVTVQRARLMFLVKGKEAVDEDELRRATESLPPSRELITAHHTLGMLAKYRRDLADAERHFERADAVALRLGDDARHSDALDELGALARYRGDFEKAEELHAEAAQVSARVGRRTNAAVSQVNRALAAMDRGALDGLRSLLDGAIRTLELQGAIDLASHTRLALAQLAFAEGDVPAAIEQAEQARRRLERSGYLPALVDACLTEAELAAYAGKDEQAQAHLKTAEAAAEKGGLARGMVVAAAIDVCRLAQGGELEAAARRATTALEQLAPRVGPQDRTALVVRLAEAVFHGLQPELLAHETLQGDELSPLAAALRAACASYGDPAARPDALYAAADALLAPNVGERRATLRVVGRWLKAEALRRDGKDATAEREALLAVEGARTLGNVAQEARLLSLLSAWTGDAQYDARRRALQDRSARDG